MKLALALSLDFSFCGMVLVQSKDSDLVLRGVAVCEVALVSLVALPEGVQETTRNLTGRLVPPWCSSS